jgi:iron complex outermembrane recepter protein
MKKSIWLLTTALLASATPAFAQDAAPQADQADAVDGSDIIVTATRRSEALSDVPLAVSAVTAQSLQNSGASDIRALNQLSPSLLVSSTSSEAGAGGARIRGIGTVGDNPGLESSVATFIDGVYRSRSGVGLTELGAVDRIEVLRGPQGTLFGRNASAGLISVITAKPSQEFGATAEATYGNYNAYRFVGGVTGPLGETLAARLDGVYSKRKGFLQDVVSGRRINNRDRWLLRGQILFEPSSDLSVRLVGDYANRNEECCGATYLPSRNIVAAGGGAVTFAPNSIAGIERALGGVIRDDTYSRRTSLTPGIGYESDVKDWGISGELTYNFGNANLTSITAYRDWSLVRGQDADFNSLDILHRRGDGSANQGFKTFTQELRLQGSAFDDRLDWLVGGYYANEKLTLQDNLQYGADYERYANCLLIAGVLPSALAPSPTGCINVPVVQATIAGLGRLPVGDPRRASIPVLGALIANPARPGFGSLAAAIGQPAITLNGNALNDQYTQKSRNFAVFTHNKFDIVPDKLSLTVGLRYTSERKDLRASFADNNVLCRSLGATPLAGFSTLPCVFASVPGGAFTPAPSRKTESEWTGTTVLSFKPTDELLTYASYSRGYKAGGFNLDRAGLARQVISPTVVGAVLPTATLSALQFDPEIVKAFEIGAKYNGKGFDLNVALFRSNFDSFQLNTFNGLNFIVTNINACSTSLAGADADFSSATGACGTKLKSGIVSKGVELEAYIRPARNLSVNLGLTYADTKYKSDLVGTNGTPLTAALFQLPGQRLSNSSQYVATGALSWTPDIGGSGLTGLVYTDFRYQSDINTGSDLDREKQQDGVAIVNARVGVRGAEQRWGIEFWAQNVFNTQYQQVSFDAPLQGGGTLAAVQRGFATSANQLFGAFLAEPRTYGITVRGKF